jgi:crotonobetainyl-CoA:carnitine CoA-transferase CaiB-like acyl-CoA transferase
MATALDGLRVLDLTSGLAGAVATMVLGDNGAEVIKVEPLEGDPDRSAPAFAQWSRGKQSVAVDLETESGRDRVRALASEADVVVETWRPGVAERLGLGYEDLVASNPGLVYCSITGFGPRGPLAGVKGYDAIVGAKAGVMAYADRPRFAAIPGASYAASQGALQGILAALYVRGTTGRGQKVEASLVQGLSGYDLYGWLGPQLPDSFASQPRAGSTFSPVSGVVGFTADGRWLQFANFRPHLVDAFLAAVDLTDWYREAMARQAPAAEINEAVLRRLHEKTLDEWMEIFMRSDDIGVEPFRTPMEALDHPQMIHNGHVIEVEDPLYGKTRQVGPLAMLHGTPAEPKSGAPALGADNDAARFSSPRAAEPVTGSAAPPSAVSPPGPLAGVTVVELAWFYAAPFGTALMADLGARVIKLEGPEGDPHRYQNPLREFSGVKALGGKESIVVDYRTPEGQEILHKIVARADLVMRNYRQQNSVLTGDDYQSLEPVNPDQVYLYAGAYGSDGPYTTRPAFAPTMGVAAGHRAYQLGWASALHHSEEITFEEGMARLDAMRLMSGGPTNNADAAAGLTVGTALVLGLVARQRNGSGQYLETSMLCSNAYVVSDDFFAFDGKVPVQHHDENGTGPLYRLYPTAEGWVFLAASLPSEWSELVGALRDVAGVDLGSDARFATLEARAANASALADALVDILAARPAREWEQVLLPHDVACVEVSQTSLSDFSIGSPTAVENGFTEEVTHPLFGTHRRHGPIVTLSETPGVVGPGCLVGQHTRKILGELGYSDDEMSALRDKGVVGWPADAEG